MTTPPPGIAARYEGVCHRCDQPIRVHDRIVYDRGRAIHAGCASGGGDE